MSGKMKIIFPVFGLAVLLMAAGCTGGKQKADSAQGALQAYVSRSFAVTGFEDKSKLIELSAGTVKASLEAISAEEFEANFTSKKREFVSLKIRDERKLAEDRYSITYEITYRSRYASESQATVDGQMPEDTVTTKKSALIERIDGHWLIAEVKNQKTFIEHKNELSF